jgi:Putative Flp pilus-assembly TadE/G-like
MFKKLIWQEAAAVSVLSALSLAVVIGISALAVEFGHGLLQRSDNQRVADLAAYAGALVYNSGASATTAKGAASNIAALNGLTSSNATVTPAIVASPRANGNQAMQVTVTTSLPMYLAEVLMASTTLPVTATGYAEIEPAAPGCIIALKSSGTGITMSGGTNITANNCSVASNNSLTLSGGATLTTKTVDYATTFPSVGGGASIVPPSGTPSVTYSKTTTSDPLCPSSGCISAVTTDTSRLSTVSSITSPVVSGGTPVTFVGGSAITTPPLPVGCTDSLVGSTHSVACTGQASYTFGAITISGGVTVNFTKGGAYYFASTAGTCGKKGPAGESICNSGNALTIAGPSTFVLAGGIYNGGGSVLTLGSGSTSNSYNIGKDSNGNSIDAGTSQSLTLADATGAGDIFQTAGNIVSGGGTCLWIPAAAQHDINGSINVAGGTTLGSGVYTVSGYVAFGDNGGGDVTCGGQAVGVSGTNVTFVIGASVTPSGNCAGQAFCVAAGFGHVTLTSPTSGSNQNLLVIGPTSTTNTAGAKFTQGASGTTLSGAFYLPNGPVNLSGSGSINNGGGCLELIGSQITLAGGSAIASTCAGIGGSNVGTSTVALVQ